MMRHCFSLGFVVSLAALASACSSSDAPVDIGDGEIGQSLTEYAASWTGYVEAFAFSDGTDKVRLTLDSEGHGSLEVGEAAHPGPATAGSTPPHTDNLLQLAVGFDYEVQLATVESSRLRFVLDPQSLFSDWCSVQTPVLLEPEVPGNYSCFAAVNFRSETAGQCEVELEPKVWTPADCMLPALCYDPICVCTASSCATAAPDLQSDHMASVDGALTDGGQTLEGTLINAGERLTIRLTRD